MKLQEIAVDSLVPNPNHPPQNFKEIDGLVASIAMIGILVPLAVIETSQGFHIVDGEKRYRAAVELGLGKLPCVVLDPQKIQTSYQSRGLSKQARDYLDKMGFVWEKVKRSKFDEMYEQLVAYKDEYGDCLVPSKWPENPRLARWVSTLRGGQHKGLTHWSDAPGFLACQECPRTPLGRAPKRVKPLQMEVVEGDTIVARCEECGSTRELTAAEARDLPRWRKEYDEREEAAGGEQGMNMLMDLGFVWNLNTHKFVEMAGQLHAYKDEYGDCLVPSKWPENPSLANWVARQRRQKRRGKLSEARVDLLDLMDFAWDTMARETAYTQYSSVGDPDDDTETFESREEVLAAIEAEKRARETATLLSAISIENFKAFRDVQEIPLAPITLLFGNNSVGKSSVMQTLLMLKQTVDKHESPLESDQDPIPGFFPTGKLVDLGTYKNLIWGQDSNRPLCLGFRFGAAEGAIWGARDNLGKTTVPLPESWCKFEFKAIAQEVEASPLFHLHRYSIGNEHWSQAYVEYIRSYGHRHDHTMEMLETAPELMTKSGPNTGNILKLETIHPASPYIDRDYNLVLKSAHDWLDQISTTIIPRIQELISNLQDCVDVSRRLQNLPLSHLISRAEQVLARRKHEFELRKHETTLENFSELQERFAGDYKRDDFFADTLKGHKSSSLLVNNFVPQRSDFTVAKWLPPNFRTPSELALLLGREFVHILQQMVHVGSVRNPPKRHYVDSYAGTSLSQLRELISPLNMWFERLEIPYTIEVPELEDGGLHTTFKVELTDKQLGITLGPMDVGYGISQVVPVLLKCLGGGATSSQPRLILIEEPEIHLHPRLQAAFGEFLAGCVNSPNTNQFIVETHSENLVLCLQRLVRNGTLTPDHVSIVYIKQDEGASKAFSIGLDEEGEFTDVWPDGFFPEGLDEVLG